MNEQLKNLLSHAKSRPEDIPEFPTGSLGQYQSIRSAKIDTRPSAAGECSYIAKYKNGTEYEERLVKIFP